MFDFLYTFWIEFLFRPVYNLVIFFYNISPGPNLGVALIGLAIFIRFLFLYFTLKGYQQDEKLSEYKPQIEKIEQESTLTPKEKIQKVSEVTRPLGINPVYSAIPLFAQIIFLGILYRIIQFELTSESYQHLYPFVAAPEKINIYFLGVDLTTTSITFAIIVAAILFLERVWEYKEKKEAAVAAFSQKWDPLIWPTGTFIILMVLPSAKAVFLASSIVFSIVIKGLYHLRKD